MSSGYITIDTSEMAHSLNNVSNRVAQTTAAVESSGEALCEVERNAANHVCRTVTTGFFSLIRSQLMQQTVQTQSVAQSQMQALRHFALLLQRIKRQMGVDFERITVRYGKLFKTLAEALQSRVYALDRPAAEVADLEYGALDRRVLMSGAPAAVVQQDAVSAQAQLEAVRCKRNCTRVIEGVKTLIEHGIKLRKAMEDIARNVHQDVERSVAVPVVMMESEDLFLDGNRQVDYKLAETPCLDSVMTKIREKLYECAGRFKWSAQSAERKGEIRARVLRRARATGDKRLVKQIADLLEKSDWKELEAVQ